MNTVVFAILGVFVVTLSAVATYAINISRERLWLLSQKTEEIYFKSDELCYQLMFFFQNRYDLVQQTTFPREPQDIRALNRQLSELNVLVGLYLPALEGPLSAVLAAASSAFHWLGVAETCEIADKEHALHSLDFSVSETRTAFERLKKEALKVGSVDRIGRVSDLLLHGARRERAQRILAVSA